MLELTRNYAQTSLPCGSKPPNNARQQKSAHLLGQSEQYMDTICPHLCSGATEEEQYLPCCTFQEAQETRDGSSHHSRSQVSLVKTKIFESERKARALAARRTRHVRQNLAAPTSFARHALKSPSIPRCLRSCGREHEYPVGCFDGSSLPCWLLRWRRITLLVASLAAHYHSHHCILNITILAISVIIMQHYTATTLLVASLATHYPEVHSS